MQWATLSVITVTMTVVVLKETDQLLALDQKILHNCQHQMSTGITKSTSFSTATACTGTVALTIDTVYTLAEAATMRLLFQHLLRRQQRDDIMLWQRRKLHWLSQLRHWHKLLQHPVPSIVGLAITGIRTCYHSGCWNQYGINNSSNTCFNSNTYATSTSVFTTIQSMTPAVISAIFSDACNTSSVRSLHRDEDVNRHLQYCSSQQWKCLCHARVASNSQMQICHRTL